MLAACYHKAEDAISEFNGKFARFKLRLKYLQRYDSKILAAIIFISSGFVNASPATKYLTVRTCQSGGRYLYRFALLQLSLEKTVSSHGPFKIDQISEDLSGARCLEYLRKEKVDIVHFANSTEREAEFQPIRIDLTKGLLGLRLFLVRNDQITKIRQIKNQDDLKGLTLGVSREWIDYRILSENGFKLEDGSNYKLLFKMLYFRRFDALPRGLNEIWYELDELKSEYQNLVVDDSIALYYPLPVYFFVSKGRQELHDRIRAGLQTALKDGSFRALFIKYYSDMIEKSHLSKRKIFILKNSVSPISEPIDTSWWDDGLFSATKAR